MSKYYNVDDVINCVADVLMEEANMRGFKPQSPDYFKDKACGVLQDLSTIEVSDDAISRNQFREQMYHKCFEVDNDPKMQKQESGNWIRWRLFADELEKAPSVILQPKEGEWIETSEGTMCGNCHKFPYDDGEYHMANWHSDYCPNCGSKMKGAEE